MSIPPALDHPFILCTRQDQSPGSPHTLRNRAQCLLLKPTESAGGSWRMGLSSDCSVSACLRQVQCSWILKVHIFRFCPPSVLQGTSEMNLLQPGIIESVSTPLPHRQRIFTWYLGDRNWVTYSPHPTADAIPILQVCSVMQAFRPLVLLSKSRLSRSTWLSSREKTWVGLNSHLCRTQMAPSHSIFSVGSHLVVRNWKF